MDESKIRIGIIGAGAITQMGHIPAFKSVSHSEIVALCDEDEEKLKFLTEKHEIPKAYTDYEKIVADKAVDALVIATPNHMHLPMIKAACSAGKHILCEKPLSRTAEEAKEICKMANESKIKFMLGCRGRIFPNRLHGGNSLILPGEVHC